MSEPVALLALIDQAPKTANDEDVDFNKDNIKGNDTNDHAFFHHNVHGFSSYLSRFLCFLTNI